MNTKLTITLMLALSIGSAYAKPPADDSVHDGNGRDLLDNITPNALGGGDGDSGGGTWTGYDHLKGRSMDTGMINVGGSLSLRYRVMARVNESGGPMLRCAVYMVGTAQDTGWLAGETCAVGGSMAAAISLSPRGLTVSMNQTSKAIPW